MPEQTTTPARIANRRRAAEALRILDEAWAYYTPEPILAPAGPDYVDIPTAA
ncbi:hypothetical protein N8I71_00245 [Roseibacterium sp. SDUM158016]|uniref:hypothetical protein n=1 Tax=Roseicyclus sediminis TaxID=2980997 RepID=UPI0021CEFEB4|nr:hypothetical protein [Roseibacterium sp. SDUM158016]MCU4651243.1 hypothetical protein [Roseibacterium sp. SDUM158016]